MKNRRNPYSSNNRSQDEELEETEENQQESKFSKITGVFGMLKIQGGNLFKKFNNLFNKLSDSRVVTFIKDKWQSETDMYEIYSIYRDLNIDNINKYIMEFYNLNEEIFEDNNSFNDIKDELKRIKLEKISVDTRELEEELHRLEQDINQKKQRRDNIMKWLSKMGYKKKNIVLDLGSANSKFIFECVKNNPKIIIIYIVVALLSLFYSILHWREYGVIGTALILGAITWGYYKVLCIAELRTVRKYVYENNQLKEEIRGDYREAFEIVKSYGKKKEDEIPKITIKEKAEVLKSNPVQSTVQQSKQEEIFNNPYADTWRMIFVKFFKTHEFKVPKYEEAENVIRFIFNIPTLNDDSFTNHSIQIGNYIGKRIYKVKIDYRGVIGNIAVEFLKEDIICNLIPYSEVPFKVRENELLMGRNEIGKWVKWNLDDIPHGLVTGTTGSGKTEGVKFLIVQTIINKWKFFLVDFKGNVDYKFLKDKYHVMTNKKEMNNLSNQLYSELQYRKELFNKYNVSKLHELNEKLRLNGEKEYPRIVLFADEYATINSDKDKISDNINFNIGQILQMGRAFGINIIIITQRSDAETIGKGVFRDNIGMREIGKWEGPSQLKMGLGVENLSKEEKICVERFPKPKNDDNEDDENDGTKGVFIFKGKGLDIIKSPYLNNEGLRELVLNKWEDNPYADYTLHYDEDDMTEDEKFLNDKIYGKENVSTINDYDQIKAEEVEVYDKFDIEDIFR